MNSRAWDGGSPHASQIEHGMWSPHMIQTEQGMWSISWMNHTSISNNGFPHMADDDKGVNSV